MQKYLGYAGLLPFVGPALAAWGLPQSSTSLNYLFITYSAVILSFVAGTLWGSLSHDPSRKARLLFILTNLVALLCWAVFFTHLLLALALLTAGFASLYYAETRWTPPQYSADYLSLRLRLTTVVILSHGILALRIATAS